MKISWIVTLTAFLLPFGQVWSEPSKLCNRENVQKVLNETASEPLVCRIGVLAIRGREIALRDFNATFSTYLSAAVGQNIYNSSISFELVPIEFSKGDNPVEEFRPELVDFVFTNPSMYSCVESLHGAAPLATFINQRRVNGQVHELEQFGGVIFARSDNDEINTISDIKGRRVASVSISGLGSGQMQFREMQRAGVHYLQDPSQLIFMENQGNVIHGVLTKQIDVGFVRTDQLERYIDRQTGNLLDLSLIKVIQPQTDVVMSNGLIFPFPMSSTFLYPEWPLAAMPHVDRRLVQDVQKTLLEMAGTADQKHDELAAIIADVFTLGKFAGWSSALSYLELRNLQRELGILDENNHCIAGTDIKDAIVCKPGYYRRGDDELDKQCALEGLDCYGFDCICKPCVLRPPVEFAPLDQTDHSCSKFDVCGKVEQGEKIQFVLKDNLLRTNATVEIDVVFDKESETHELDQMKDIPYQYIFEFDSRNRMIDVAILDIYVDGEQIDLSPVRLDIIERNCIAATGNSRRIADAYGNCICDSTAIAFGSSFCLPNGVIVAISLGPVLLFISYFAWRYIAEKHREANFWVIEDEDLMFEADVRVLGRGSFGCVLEASYRGSLVAVKGAMPSTDSQYKSNLSEIQNIFKQASFKFMCEKSGDILPRNEAPVQHSQNLSSTLLQTSRSRKAFQEEMQKMATLRHPCITTLFGAVLNKNAEPMLVMEHMELGSLRDLIRNVTLVLETETILSILLDAISGLKFLHSAEPVILHKDLKPTNILIDSKFRAKISDFCLSKKQNLDHLKAIASLSYVAPELIQDEATHSTASDVFAFGVVMTEVLFRKIPYEDEHMHVILDSVDDRSTDQRLNIPDVSKEDNRYRRENRRCCN